MVGDTDTTDPLIQDAEIAYILIQFPKVDGNPPWLAAAHTCDAIAGRFGRRAQRAVGSLSIAAQQQFEHYRQMAADFRLLYASNGRAVTGMSGVVAASPVLGGGGRTFLGTNAYQDPEGL
jgi:hypothetical protein